MAKPKVQEVEEVEQVSEIEETKKDSQVEQVIEVESATKRIRIIEPLGKCVIGKYTLFLDKGKEYNVPVEVLPVLRRTGAIREL